MIHRGIICQGDISVVGHSLFNNFRLALTNYFKCNFIDVKQISDLQELHELYIIDEHFQYHKDVWMNNTFIEYLNKNNIEVFIFNFEKFTAALFLGILTYRKM